MQIFIENKNMTERQYETIRNYPKLNKTKIIINVKHAQKTPS